ncbi:AKR_collapsed_G0005700.mRNA.1.CDS.1 [Saccharomyces cerevisiae]|nr:AKR_collapsed_G0005700.mRNA.1.CDS.1 [Saccharomyces cerevisiae]
MNVFLAPLLYSVLSEPGGYQLFTKLRYEMIPTCNKLGLIRSLNCGIFMFAYGIPYEYSLCGGIPS